MIGLLVLTVLGIAVGVGIMQSMGQSDTPADNSIAETVRNADYPICGEYDDGERIRYKDLETIVYARHIGKCDSAANEVVLDFTLSERRLEDFAEGFHIVDSDGNPLVLYTSGCTAPGGGAGFDGIVAPDTGDEILFAADETVQIGQEGEAVTLCSP